mmetsp:Transcript_30523/g.64308  ORF Transcript_30523/g.64308 Transcript_30523/m.64308 type:complete len:117 (-) Transcript_30523:2087-2437(-)
MSQNRGWNRKLPTITLKEKIQGKARNLPRKGSVVQQSNLHQESEEADGETPLNDGMISEGIIMVITELATGTAITAIITTIDANNIERGLDEGSEEEEAGKMNMHKKLFKNREMKG